MANKKSGDAIKVREILQAEMDIIKAGGGTQEDLGNILGVNKAYISEILRGRKSGVRKVSQFARALGLNISAFYEGGMTMKQIVSEEAIEKFRNLDVLIQAANNLDDTMFAVVLRQMAAQLEDTASDPPGGGATKETPPKK